MTQTICPPQTQPVIVHRSHQIQVAIDLSAVPTSLCFQGASLEWYGTAPWEEAPLPGLENRGQEPLWVGLSLRIVRFQRQGWQNAHALAAALSPAFGTVRITPEGVTALLLTPLGVGCRRQIFTRSEQTLSGLPIQVELQAAAIPSPGLARLSASQLLLPVRGLR